MTGPIVPAGPSVGSTRGRQVAWEGDRQDWSRQSGTPSTGTYEQHFSPVWKEPRQCTGAPMAISSECVLLTLHTSVELNPEVLLELSFGLQRTPHPLKCRKAGTLLALNTPRTRSSSSSPLSSRPHLLIWTTELGPTRAWLTSSPRPSPPIRTVPSPATAVSSGAPS